MLLRRLLIDILPWSERCCDRNVVCCSDDTAAISVVIVVFGVIIVPVSVIVTVINRNICSIDPEEIAGRYLLGKLVD